MPVIFNLPTVVFLLYVLLVTPLFSWLGFLRVKSSKPLASKVARFRGSVFYLVTVPLFAIIAADSNHLHIPLRVSVVDLIFIAIVASYLGYFGSLGVRKRCSPQMQRNRILYAPKTQQELRWALTAGVCAGIGEEIIYRYVLFELIYRFCSSVVIAVVVCVVTFAQSHMTQGIKGVIAVGYLGLVFHVLFLTTHTLAVPMGVHVIYDVVIFTTWYVKEKQMAQPVSDSRTVGQSA